MISSLVDNYFSLSVPGFFLRDSVLAAVFSESRNALAVGAPDSLGFLMRSPDPALMRALLAAMLEYSPCAIFNPINVYRLRSLRRSKFELATLDLVASGQPPQRLLDRLPFSLRLLPDLLGSHIRFSFNNI